MLFLDTAQLFLDKLVAILAQHAWDDKLRAVHVHEAMRVAVRLDTFEPKLHASLFGSRVLELLAGTPAGLDAYTVDSIRVALQRVITAVESEAAGFKARLAVSVSCETEVDGLVDMSSFQVGRLTTRGKDKYLRLSHDVNGFLLGKQEGITAASLDWLLLVVRLGIGKQFVRYRGVHEVLISACGDLYAKTGGISAVSQQDRAQTAGAVQCGLIPELTWATTHSARWLMAVNAYIQLICTYHVAEDPLSIELNAMGDANVFGAAVFNEDVGYKGAAAAWVQASHAYNTEAVRIMATLGGRSELMQGGARLSGFLWPRFKDLFEDGVRRWKAPKRATVGTPGLRTGDTADAIVTPHPLMVGTLVPAPRVAPEAGAKTSVLAPCRYHAPKDGLVCEKAGCRFAHDDNQRTTGRATQPKKRARAST